MMTMHHHQQHPCLPGPCFLQDYDEGTILRPPNLVAGRSPALGILDESFFWFRSVLFSQDTLVVREGGDGDDDDANNDGEKFLGGSGIMMDHTYFFWHMVGHGALFIHWGTRVSPSGIIIIRGYLDRVLTVSVTGGTISPEPLSHGMWYPLTYT